MVTNQPQRRRLSLPISQPRVTYVILAIDILVFLAITLAGGSTNTRVLVIFGAKVNQLIVAGQFWRLFTSMFLHIGVMHLLFNAYALYFLGIEVERLYGSLRFVAIFILSGLCGSLASFALSSSLSAGASGAIFGLLGTMVAFFLHHRDMFGEWGRQRLISFLGIVGLNLFFGFTVPGIDNFAHLGGLVCGVFLGYSLAPNYAVAWSPDGGPQLVDRPSLLKRWGAIALTAFCLLVGIAASVVWRRVTGIY